MKTDRSTLYGLFSVFEIDNSEEDRGASNVVEYTLAAVVFLSLVGGISLLVVEDVNSLGEDVAELELESSTVELANTIDAVNDTMSAQKNISQSVDEPPSNGFEPSVQKQITLPETTGEIEYTVQVKNGVVSAQTQPTGVIGKVINVSTPYGAKNVETLSGVSSGETIIVYYNTSTNPERIEFERLSEYKELTE